MRPLGAALALVLLTACDTKQLVVESDTHWAGRITSGTMADTLWGSGNTAIDLARYPSALCWRLVKTTDVGSLRAYLRDKTWFGLGTDTDGDQTTSYPGGVVFGCNE